MWIHDSVENHGSCNTEKGDDEEDLDDSEKCSTIISYLNAI